MSYPSGFYITEHDLGELRILSKTIMIKKKSKIVKLRQTRLRKRILELIASTYSITAIDLTIVDYGNAKNYLRNLNKLGLIEEIALQQKTSKKKTNKEKKYYMLTSKGVYYMLSNNRDLPYGILKAMLEKYNNHILFRLFVYPYVARSTLLKIIDSSIFSLLCKYINDCCKRIQEIFKSIDKTYNSQDGYLIDQLCIWNNVSKEEYDTNALSTFLTQKLKWDWLHKALITKTYDGNGITVSSGSESILIILNQEKTKATLIFRGKKLYEFIVKEITSNGESENMLIMYTNEFFLSPNKGFSQVPLVQMHLGIFERFLQSRVMELIFSLSLVYRARLTAIEILAQDQNFIKQLNATKHHFDRWYSFFFANA